MITDAETLKMKRQILDEISQKYKNILEEKLISAEEAKTILKSIETDLAHTFNDEMFSRNVLAFGEQYPAFRSIAEKVKNRRNELLQNIGRESIEDLMETDIEQWSDLSEKLEKVDETHLRDWVVKLPPKNKHILFEKTSTHKSNEHGR